MSEQVSQRFGLVDRRRRAAGGEQSPGGRGDLAGERAQLVVERDRLAPARLAVEQGALGHGCGKHLLEAERLGAELDLVRAVRFRPAALVLDRIGPPAFSRPGQLDHVGDPGDAERARADRHALDDAALAAARLPGLVALLVQDAPLGGQHILGPQPLDVDQRALPRAEQIVLQRREGDEVCIRRPRPAAVQAARRTPAAILRSMVTPAGRSLSSTVTR